MPVRRTEPIPGFSKLEFSYRNRTDLRIANAQLRKHPERQYTALMASMKVSGPLPVIVDNDSNVLDGVATIEAARRLGIDGIPTVCVSGLTPHQLKMLRIAINRIPQLAEFDMDALRFEFEHAFTFDADFSFEVTGFNTAEIDVILTPPTTPEVADEKEEVEAPEAIAVSKVGDLWLAGGHRLLCGSSLDDGSWNRLMAGEVGQMVFADPPYNVPIKGHVSGRGKAVHREFEMAAGEMSEKEFIGFVTSALQRMADAVADGAVLEICMDWRGLYALQTGARNVGLSTLNLCVWNKTNAGMGSLFRSKHELILILKKGKAPHINNVELGKHGRFRSNVWDFAGANSFGPSRDADLADHPTVKPTALVTEAIRDVTRHGDIVVDGFMGSGSTILAAERSHRRAYGIELDPLYVDVAIRRWQKATGLEATLEATGETFAQVADRLQGEGDDPAAPVERSAPTIRHRARPNVA